ncbi:MAG: hypothetical protein HRT35_22675 [Algicola sp.]|nr:hypothetical protein [Algicola sp.]
MKIFNALLATCVLACSSTAMAENVWKTQTNIEGVQALHDGSYILYLPLGTDSTCNEGGKLFRVAENQNQVTQEGARNLLTVALVAYTSKKKVSVLYDNGSASCYVQQIHLRNDS